MLTFGGNAGFAVGPLFVTAVLAAAGTCGTAWLAPGTIGGFALLTSAVIVRSVFFFGLSSLLALYVGTGLHGGRQAGRWR